MAYRRLAEAAAGGLNHLKGRRDDLGADPGPAQGNKPHGAPPSSAAAGT